MQLALIENGKRQTTKASPNFRATYELIVVGLGTAGTEAALTAAARGLKTLGVERQIAMGGQSTLGCVWFKSKGTPPPLLSAEVLKHHHATFPIQQFSIPERMALYEREADETDLDLAYETIITGVYLEEDTIRGLRLCHHGLTTDVKAKLVIDATGNATVAAMAGCHVQVGREFDQAQAAVSKAVLWEQPQGGYRPRYGFFRDSPNCSKEEYSQLIVRLSRKWPCLWNGRKRRVLQQATILGAREEGHVKTIETLTLHDCLAAKPVTNPILHTFVPLDLVRIDEDWAFENRDVQNWKVLCGLLCFGFFASVPYGTLIPQGVDGLLVPSKHLGVAHDAASGIRMEADMRKTGYAAACAATLAIRKGLSPKDLPYHELLPLLEQGGLTQRPYKTNLSIYQGPKLKDMTIPELLTALKQDIVLTDPWIFRASYGPREQAAHALYSAWMAPVQRTSAEQRTLADSLLDAIRHKGRHAGNMAIALGLMGDRRACPMLRSIIQYPGDRHPDHADPVIHNAYPNRIKAICLLGRLRDQLAIPLLLDIVMDNATAFTQDLSPCHMPEMSQVHYQFQTLSFALFSLVDLLQAYPNAHALAQLRLWARRPLVLSAGRAGHDCADMLRRILLKSNLL